MTTSCDGRPRGLDRVRGRDLPARWTQLLLGLALYGFSLALMVRSGLGLAPWDVLHSGIAARLPLTIGQVIVLVSLLLLVLWIPLRERPGLGTVANALLVGLAADATLAVLEQPASVTLRVTLLLVGVLLNGVATGLYIGAGFGRGPRDGLMTGLVRVTGRSIRLVRTAIEVVVVLVGVALGGALGVGTLVYAVAIGPLAQVFIPVFDRRARRVRRTARGARRDAL